jgi:hypothetical protein
VGLISSKHYLVYFIFFQILFSVYYSSKKLFSLLSSFFQILFSVLSLLFQILFSVCQFFFLCCCHNVNWSCQRVGCLRSRWPPASASASALTDFGKSQKRFQNENKQVQMPLTVLVNGFAKRIN